MKATLLLLGLGILFGTSGCAGHHEGDGAVDGANQDITSSSCIKVGGTCIPNGMGKLPKVDAGTFVDGKCFAFQLVDPNTTDEKVKQAAIDKVLTKLSESRDKNPDALTQMRLRVMEKYFDVTDDELAEPMNPMTAPFEKVFGVADGPIFTQWQLKSNGQKYSQIDIALGDNPMDLVFKQGTLDPVAVVQDGSVTFCADEVR